MQRKEKAESDYRDKGIISFNIHQQANEVPPNYTLLGVTI